MQDSIQIFWYPFFRFCHILSMSPKQKMQRAKQASRSIALLSSEEKNTLLLSVANLLEENIQEILLENAKDMTLQEQNSMNDRLLLTPERIKNMANEVRSVANLPDPVGEILDTRRHANGLEIERIRVPLGVVGMIYESRPNVTIDAAVLCLKAGNAVVLKGGKEAIHSNRALANTVRQALEAHGYSPEAVQFLDPPTRNATAQMLSAREFLDVLIPRGGKGLIEFVLQNATVPVLETGASVVHTYVDASADISSALTIVVNEKIRRVSVCNALDTLLLHHNVAEDFLPLLSDVFQMLSAEQGVPLVRIFADSVSRKIFQKEQYPALFSASSKTYATEWLDYAMNIRLVSGLDEALEHIRTYSLGHSESVCAEDRLVSERFLREVDSACVYHNASTCFSDGAEFGLGAEIGISTQKLHARGPFALEALTSTKWIIRGSGQIRN